VNEFEVTGVVPSLHHRKEGWLRHQKMLRSNRCGATGVVFLLIDQSENHPGLALNGCFAMFLDALGHPSLRSCKEGTTPLTSNSSTRVAVVTIG
jgi:hypothetical protein